jgi:hypothetical protein
MFDNRTHPYHRYACPYCELDECYQPTIELETTDGESYTCPVCGCVTSSPEDDACVVIEDEWEHALDLLECQDFNVTVCGNCKDGYEVELEHYTGDLGGDMIHTMFIHDLNDVEELVMAFDEQVYEAFDPWAEAVSWCDSEGNPQNCPTSSGARLYEDLKAYEQFLARANNRFRKGMGL